jgi:hypothetical protein
MGAPRLNGMAGAVICATFERAIGPRSRSGGWQ